MMKLLRTIRLDASDSFVFEKAAEPGEWAVSGAFEFAGRDPAGLRAKVRSAFRAGFLGLTSLGRSTLVQIVEASDADRGMAVDLLTHQLVAHFRAPDAGVARPAAQEEIDFAASLCVYPADTVIAVTRSQEDGAIRETFRMLRPREGASHAPAFEFLDLVGEEDAASEPLDLRALSREVG